MFCQGNSVTSFRNCFTSRRRYATRIATWAVLLIRLSMLVRQTILLLPFATLSSVWPLTGCISLVTCLIVARAAISLWMRWQTIRTSISSSATTMCCGLAQPRVTWHVWPTSCVSVCAMAISVCLRTDMALISCRWQSLRWKSIRMTHAMPSVQGWRKMSPLAPRHVGLLHKCTRPSVSYSSNSKHKSFVVVQNSKWRIACCSIKQTSKKVFVGLDGENTP